MAEAKTVQVGFRVNPKKGKALAALSAATQRPRSWLLEQALDDYLESQSWQVAHIKVGLAEAETGQVIPHDEIREWLMTWGNEKEGEPPF